MADGRVRCDLNTGVRLTGIIHRDERGAFSGGELHALGQHDHEMLGAINRPGIDADLAVVRQVEGNLELSFARPQGENKGVAVFLFLRNRSGINGLTAGGLSHGLVDLRTFGQIKLEILIVHLGAWRIRGVVDRKQTDARQFVPLRLKAHHIGRYLDSCNLFCNVEDLYFDRSSSGRGHTVVSHSLVNYADEMRPTGVELKS